MLSPWGYFALLYSGSAAFGRRSCLFRRSCP
ncbi:MprA protease, GlyGly-CTERM protein-sorting domain-containing form [Lawsonibacter celer]